MTSRRLSNSWSLPSSETRADAASANRLRPDGGAVSWRILTQAGIEVDFATPDGAPSAGDPLMLTGNGFDLWAPLKIMGLMLPANGDARRDYGRMVDDGGSATQTHSLCGHRHQRLRREACVRICKTVSCSRRWLNFSTAESPLPPSAMASYWPPEACRQRPARVFCLAARTTALTWKLERTDWTLMNVAGRRWDPD